MDKTAQDKRYKSPARKLVHFFEKSRDQWKAKHRKSKANGKRLSNRVRFLEKSKEHWKQRAQELEQEVTRLKAREHALQQAQRNLGKKESLKK